MVLWCYFLFFTIIRERIHGVQYRMSYMPSRLTSLLAEGPVRSVQKTLLEIKTSLWYNDFNMK